MASASGDILSGTVTDADSGTPLSGVKVSVDAGLRRLRPGARHTESYLSQPMISPFGSFPHRSASRVRLSRIALALAALSLFACARTVRLKPFASDGCSLFPDGDTRSGSWCACCFEHDLAYWKGGPEEERKAADSALGDCILARTRDSTLARAVYLGTRAGGSPYFPTWYRWGYGWPYGLTGVNAVPDSARAREVRKRTAAMDRAAAARKACGADFVDTAGPKAAKQPK